MEITGERMAYWINRRFILTKSISLYHICMVYVYVYTIYKNKIQTDWRTEYKKQNS